MSGDAAGSGQAVDAMCKKREDYLEWCEYFMAVAFLSAQRSKDPSSQRISNARNPYIVPLLHIWFSIKPKMGVVVNGMSPPRQPHSDESRCGDQLIISIPWDFTEVGACIVNPENKIVGIGYNGMPNGCHDDVLPWARTASDRLDTKYPYVCHAELNAIMNKNSADVKGCIMYVALFPCNECAKLIIQAGIKEVIYMSDKYHDTPEMKAARHMFDLTGIKYTKFVPKRKSIVIDFDSINNTKKSSPEL